jgi:hypothetical protein
MLFRAIALSLALLVSIGTIIPFMTDYTEAGPKHHKKQKRKKLKKYSKAWWRWYHKTHRHNRAIAARKRALRLRQMTLAKQRTAENGNPEQTSTVKADSKQSKSRPKIAVQEDSSPAILPSGESAPQTWKRTQSSSSEQQFRVSDDTGNQLGTASLSVVGPAVGTDTDTGRNKTLGGVSTGALRRTVIDKMVKEEGWVVNDYQKEVNGKKVYVVVAQSAVRGTIQSRLFYFTEVDGRIYSLATNSSSDSAERIARESEKVINSLQKPNRPVQAELTIK